MRTMVSWILAVPIAVAIVILSGTIAALGVVGITFGFLVSPLIDSMVAGYKKGRHIAYAFYDILVKNTKV